MSRNKVDRIYDLMISCYRRVNQLHEQLEADHLVEEICEKFSNYKRQLPLQLLEKTADVLDGRKGELVFLGFNDVNRPLLINGFLSRPGLLPVPYEGDLLQVDRFPVKIMSAGFGKDEKVDVIYKSSKDVIEYLFSRSVVKDFLKPFEKEIEQNPLCLQDIFADYLKAFESKEGEDDTSTEADELYEVAQCLSKKIVRLGGRFRESFEKKDDLLSPLGQVPAIEVYIIKEVHIIVDNVFLKENRLTVVDYPAKRLEVIDEEWAKDVAGASAIVQIAEVIDLDNNGFKALNDKLDVLDCKANQFFILNGFENLLSTNINSEFVDGLFQKLEKYIGPKLSKEKTIFTSGYRVALAGLMNQPNKTKEDEADFEALIRDFHEKKQGLDVNITKEIMEKLHSVYSDGGISQIRNKVLDYFSIDLLLSKCEAAKEPLYQLIEYISDLIGKPKGKSKEVPSVGADPVQKILDPFVSVLLKVKEDILKTEEAVRSFEKINNRLKTKISKSLKATKNDHWDKIISEKGWETTDQIVQGLLDISKEEYSQIFISSVEGEVKNYVRSRYLGHFDRKAIQKKFKAFDELVGAEYTAKYEEIEANFITKLNWIVESKTVEMTWGIKKLMIKPKFEGNWEASVANQFLNDLQTFFTNRFAKSVDSLCSDLNEYFNCYGLEFIDLSDKLLDRIQKEVLKNVGTNKEGENEIYKKIRKHIKQQTYLKDMYEIDKLKQEVQYSVQ